jgi:retinol dehydrogenase-14
MRVINCLVTGGTSGVGRSIAKALARSGARVMIVSRDAARAEAAAEALRKETGNSAVDSVAADFSRLSSVRALAEAVRRKYSELHVLSNNAACLTMTRELTPDVIESIFAVNYLSHFLLANLLEDFLKAGAPSRVITVSGQPRLIARFKPQFDDLRSERAFSPLAATLRAAIAKVLFTFELARRFSGTGVTANTFHPGLVRSGLPSHLPLLLRVPVSAASLFFASESATGNYVALSPEVETVTGKCFERRRAVAFEPAYDAAAASRELWEISSRLCGLA